MTHSLQDTITEKTQMLETGFWIQTTVATK